MSNHIRIHGISSENDFNVLYKSGNTLNSEINGFTMYNSYDSSVSTVTISGVPINFGTQYWVKIQDKITNRYTIKNINIHESCYYECFDTTPTPTPTPTPSPTPTLSVNSASICIGDGKTQACQCTNTATVYFLGTLKEGVTLYTSNTLTTKYYNGLYPNINYNNNLFVYPLGGGPLVADGICITPTPTPTPTSTPATPTPTPTPTRTPTPTPTPRICKSVDEMYIESGNRGGVYYIQATIIVSNLLSGYTEFELTIETENLGPLTLTVPMLENRNYVRYVYDIGAGQNPGNIISSCISNITGDATISCKKYECNVNSCPCVETTPTPTPSSTPTPTPTKAGHCVTVANTNPLNSIDISYYATSGILNCLTIGPNSSVNICIQLDTYAFVRGYESNNGTCTGNPIILNIVDNGTMCSNNGEC